MSNDLSANMRRAALDRASDQKRWENDQVRAAIKRACESLTLELDQLSATHGIASDRMMRILNYQANFPAIYAVHIQQNWEGPWVAVDAEVLDD